MLDSNLSNLCVHRSSGVFKALKADRCGCYSRGVSATSESSKLFSSIRAVSVSSSTKYYDFTVIGSGVAGLRYALEVAKQGTVAVITKDEPHESNTNYAQGGVSAVLCPLDSVESHMQDTMVAGAHLCDEETVRVSSYF